MRKDELNKYIVELCERKQMPYTRSIKKLIESKEEVANRNANETSKTDR